MLFRTVIITQFVGFYNCFCSRCRYCFIFASANLLYSSNSFCKPPIAANPFAALQNHIFYKTFAAIGGRRFNGLVHQKIEYADVQRIGELIAIHFVAKQFFVLRVG